MPTNGRSRASVATLPPVGAHWVWVADALFAHSRLFDGDSGDMLAAIDAGVTISPKPPLFSKSRNEFYSVETAYSRGRRGERIDFVTIYDAETLDVTGEIVLPTKTSESAASLGYAELLDDDRFLGDLQPAAQHERLDQRSRDAQLRGRDHHHGLRGNLSHLGTELSPRSAETARCCRCNSTTRAGRSRRSATARFFDVVEDPVMMSGGRVGSRWVFASFGGMAHDVDFAVSPPAVRSWPMTSETESKEGWRPGGRQLLTVHAGSERLYVLFHKGEAGSHKDPGSRRSGSSTWRRRRVSSGSSCRT